MRTTISFVPFLLLVIGMANAAPLADVEVSVQYTRQYQFQPPKYLLTFLDFQATNTITVSTRTVLLPPATPVGAINFQL
jgi:hypothetical protein